MSLNFLSKLAVSASLLLYSHEGVSEHNIPFQPFLTSSEDFLLTWQQCHQEHLLFGLCPQGWMSILFSWRKPFRPSSWGRPVVQNSVLLLLVLTYLQVRQFTLQYTEAFSLAASAECALTLGLVQKRSRKVLTSRISVCCCCDKLPPFQWPSTVYICHLTALRLEVCSGSLWAEVRVLAAVAPRGCRHPAFL